MSQQQKAAAGRFVPPPLGTVQLYTLEVIRNSEQLRTAL